MKETVTHLLGGAAERLVHRGLFGRDGDQLSMRVPGGSELVWLAGSDPQVRTAKLSGADSIIAPHAAIYRTREDAGGVLLSTTCWSEQLCAIGQAPPTLFDEQARHIGAVAAPVAADDLHGLLGAIRGGANVALWGAKSVRIGMTRDRVVFNAELFEKCSMAYAIAYSSGRPIKTTPFWVRYIAGRRLRKDQQRAAQAYAAGKIPDDVTAY